jgi:hypothetical protein
MDFEVKDVSDALRDFGFVDHWTRLWQSNPEYFGSRWYYAFSHIATSA